MTIDDDDSDAPASGRRRRADAGSSISVGAGEAAVVSGMVHRCQRPPQPRPSEMPAGPTLRYF